METKKQLRIDYCDCLSRNRIDDVLIQKACNKIESLRAQGYDIKMTIKNVVDYAYDMQK